MENLLVIRDKKLAERYIKNWQGRERHSKGGAFYGNGFKERD